MNISAHVKSSRNLHEIIVETNNDQKTLTIAPKANGYGSSVNGGELLLLALATCCCNDLYREAVRRNIQLDQVEVKCTADFGKEGEPGDNFKYHVNIVSDASADEIKSLIGFTDKVAEIHNTLRKGVSVQLSNE